MASGRLVLRPCPSDRDRRSGPGGSWPRIQLIEASRRGRPRRRCRCLREIDFYRGFYPRAKLRSFYKGLANQVMHLTCRETDFPLTGAIISAARCLAQWKANLALLQAAAPRDEVHDSFLLA